MADPWKHVRDLAQAQAQALDIEHAPPRRPTSPHVAPRPTPSAPPASTGSKWTRINQARFSGPKMTRPERAYHLRLEALAAAGDVQWWCFEAAKLKLAPKSWYTPDFLVVDHDGQLFADEIKGARGWKLDDESRTKWKIAAALFPAFRFRGWTMSREGAWTCETPAGDPEPIGRKMSKG